jgi:hypothetical protein
VSQGGLEWDFVGKAYGFDINFTDGSGQTFGRRERPQVLLIEGEPAVLYNGVDDVSGFGWVHTLAQRIATTSAGELPSSTGRLKADDSVLPWAPPPPDSPALLASLRNTSRPKLAYSTYIGWYEDGGLNESTLFAQVEVMSTQLRSHGWDTVLHDYGWQVCVELYPIVTLQYS